MPDLFSAVEIEINHACNRKCSYCPNDQFERRSKGEIDPSLFQKILDELKSIRYQGRVSFSFYNEPTLHPNLVGLIRQTREALPGSSLEMYTNGTRLTLALIQDLISAGLSKFIVTRHEMDQDNPRYPFHQLYPALPAEIKNRIEYRDYQKVKLFNRGGLLKDLGAATPLLPCHIPSHVVTITVTGNVLPCFEDYNEQLVMGNLQKDSLMDIWRSESYLNFREKLKKGLRHQHSPCNQCNRTLVLPPF